jgi:sulfur carrier protein
VNIMVNGEQRQVADGASLAAIVTTLIAAHRGVAAAVNGDVVRRGAWESTALAPGDEIEIVTAVQGG